ncbi:uncharacterized protein LOC133800592 [Humulus lupulus]|uniref:uncharacterized protein LOC133800592 n=1 Tax=Humulus lupulus TaxID=3486 RepID=UPI002B417485|nr:uncharacterized protein LOC133800592 [Humulus lupulus]
MGKATAKAPELVTSSVCDFFQPNPAASPSLECLFVLHPTQAHASFFFIQPRRTPFSPHRRCGRLDSKGKGGGRGGGRGFDSLTTSSSHSSLSFIFFFADGAHGGGDCSGWPWFGVVVAAGCGLGWLKLYLDI